MYTSYVYSLDKYEFLEPYNCFGNHYLVNSDGSKVNRSQINGSGIFREEFLSNRKDLNDFEVERLSTQEISDIQFEMRGAITTFIFNDEFNEIYIIPDPMGLSIIFYYLSPRISIFSTNLNEIKRILNQMDVFLEKNEKFLFEVIAFGNGGASSEPYKGILSLNPYEFVYIKSEGFRIVKNKNLDSFLESIDNVTTDEIINQFEKDIKRNLYLVSNYPTRGQFISQLTGGFDSRLLLAGIMNQGLEKQFLFFCSGKDGTSDKDTSKNLCRHYNLSFTDYSGYVLNRAPESATEPALWSLENTSGISYSAHNHYDKRDNVILSGGLGGQVMSSNTIKHDPKHFDDFRELLSSIWPYIKLNSSKSLFKNKYIEELKEVYLKRLSEGKYLGIEEDALPDYFYQTVRARYYTGQISFFMSNTNPRFDALYSPKASLMGLKLDLISRRSNIVGISVMDNLYAGLVNLPFGEPKINEDYIKLKGPIDKRSFNENRLKIFTDYDKTKVRLPQKNKSNAKEYIKRANKLTAAFWQVEQEQNAKDDLKKIIEKIPLHIRENYLNMSYINNLLYKDITNRVDLRQLHYLRNNLMWYIT